MLINLLGYWLLGLPLSIYLGFVVGLGPVGLWWGLVLGLAIVATSLLLRVRGRLSRTQSRVVIDHHFAPSEPKEKGGSAPPLLQ
jgi:Na+-driven multidrug efflux pump